MLSIVQFITRLTQKFFFFFIICLTAVACSSNWAYLEPESILIQRLDKWKYLKVSRLYLKIGKPTEITRTPEGHQLLIYLQEIKSPDSKTWHCKISFLVNNRNEIVGTSLLSREENTWGIYMPCTRIIKAPYADPEA
jgi:hypothetical protein